MQITAAPQLAMCEFMVFDLRISFILYGSVDLMSYRRKYIAWINDEACSGIYCQLGLFSEQNDVILKTLLLALQNTLLWN